MPPDAKPFASTVAVAQRGTERARLQEVVWPALKAYHAVHGHPRVPIDHRGDVEDVHLGETVRNIRNQKAFLQHADFAAWLRARGFRMHTRDERADRAAWARMLPTAP